MQKLIDTHSKTIKEASRRAAYKYGVEAEDLEQDLWLKLAEDANAAMKALRDGHPYIYTMAYNRAINIKRRERWESVADLTETTPEEEVDGQLGPWLTETVDGSITQPERDLMWEETLREAQEHVHGLVAQAPEAFRAVLEAYYLKGQTYLEAAEALGLPINTVKSKLSRARVGLGATEAALRAWREFWYPEARRPDLGANRPHSGALLGILRG